MQASMMAMNCSDKNEFKRMTAKATVDEKRSRSSNGFGGRRKGDLQLCKNSSDGSEVEKQSESSIVDFLLI